MMSGTKQLTMGHIARPLKIKNMHTKNRQQQTVSTFNKYCAINNCEHI